MDHDGAHKFIYVLPEVQADLLRLVIPEWVEDLDLDGLADVSAEFHDAAHRRRTGDMVLRCPFKNGALLDGSRPYALFLVEFQSTMDRRMAERLRRYTGMLLDRLRRRGVVRREGGLPPVQAIVVYNGAERWTAPGEESELASAPSAAAARALALMQPQCYRRVDERMESAQHWAVDNRVAATVRLQADASAPDLRERLRRELRRFPGEANRGLRQGFHAWARALWEGNRLGDGPPFPSFEEFEREVAEEEGEGEEEMTTITRAIHERWLASLRDEARRQGRQEGHRQGHREGREEGWAEGVEQARAGERTRLCRQAALRFGAERTSRLPDLLDGIAAREDLDRVADWIVECDDAVALLGLTERLLPTNGGNAQRNVQ